MNWFLLGAGAFFIAVVVSFVVEENGSYKKKVWMFVMILSGLFGLAAIIGTVGGLIEIMVDGRTDIRRLRSSLILIPICAGLYFGAKRMGKIR